MERLEIEILASVSGLEKSLNSAQAKLEKFGKAAQDLGGGLSKALTLPIAGFGVASIKAFGDIQALKNGLTAVTGSAEVAGAQFIRLQKLAKLPGLGLEEVAKGAINLQTIGFSATKAESAMGAFGNAVATVGKGKAEFERAIYGLQQLANTDFPLGEDLNILKDAIPQITPLLKDAFGTARSDDLQKLGITSSQVVDTILAGLNKLPPVTGGVNGAFENLGDGVKTNLAEIGESINTAFDISGIIDAFIEKLSGITAAFKSLSPQTQKIIIIIAGVVAALGPVIFTIGLITTSVIPALTAGLTVLSGAFVAITGPIAAIAIAIGAAVYLIIKYWDDIVSYFTSGDGKTVFDTLIETFNSAIGYIKAAWQQFTKLLSAFWDEWGGTIIAIAKNIFDSVIKVLDVAFTLIGAAFKVGTAILTGNWSAIGPILLNTTKKVWNAIIGIIANAIQATAGLIGKFLEFVGLDGVSKKVNDITNAVKKKLSFDIPVKLDVQDTETKSASSGFSAVKTTVTNKVQQLSDTAKKVKEIYANLSNDLEKNSLQFGATGIEIREDDIKSYQKAIDGLIENGYKPAGKAIQDLVNKQSALADVQKVEVAAAQVKEIYTNLAKDLEKNTIQIGTGDSKTDDIKSYQKAIDGLIEQGYTPASEAVQKLVDKQKSLFDLQQVETGAKKIKDIYENLAKDLEKNEVKFGDKDTLKADNINSYQQAINNLIENGYKPQSAAIQELIDKQKALSMTPLIDKLNKDFQGLSQSILQSGVSDAFGALGESIGGALANGGNLMQTLGSSLLGIIGGIATQLGKAAIGVGVAMIGIKNAFKSPLTAIAAGVALIALGAFISSKVANMTQGNSGGETGNAAPMKQFANGGIISGPTVGLMGEYAGAKSNPEVVAPLNKLKGMLPAAEESTIIPDLKLRGEDIYVSFKRVSKRMGGLT